MGSQVGDGAVTRQESWSWRLGVYRAIRSQSRFFVSSVLPVVLSWVSLQGAPARGADGMAKGKRSLGPVEARATDGAIGETGARKRGTGIRKGKEVGE